MKDFRFYLEYPSNKDKRKGANNCGTVVAIMPESYWFRIDIMYEAIGSVYDYADSPCCGCSASLGYLSEKCKRIPEVIARIIHPELFKYLDQ